MSFWVECGVIGVWNGKFSKSAWSSTVTFSKLAGSLSVADYIIIELFWLCDLLACLSVLCTVQVHK